MTARSDPRVRADPPRTAGEHGRYTLGGFTDATFRVMSVLESGQQAHWPF